MHRILPAICILSIMLLNSCTRSMVVADEEWEKGQAEYEGDYFIKTSDGREIHAERFSRTDSTMIIYDVKGDGDPSSVYPMILPLSEIESIKEKKSWWLGMAIGIPILVGAGYLAFLAVFAAGLQGFD